MRCSSYKHSGGYLVGAQESSGPTLSSPTKPSRLLLEVDSAEGRLNSLLEDHPPTPRLPPWPSPQHGELESVTQAQEGSGGDVQ